MVLDSLTPTVLGPYYIGSKDDISATNPLVDMSALDITAYLCLPGETKVEVAGAAFGALAGVTVTKEHDWTVDGLVAGKYLLEWIIDEGGGNQDMMFPNANVGNPIFVELHDRQSA